jgi:hypothetical protein
VIDGKYKLEVTMKILRNSARQLVKTMLVFGFTSAIGVIPLFAQVTNSGTLANLANGGTLSIDDKTFSGFSYTPTGLTSFDPSQIIVTATENGGIDYLTWSGNISLVSGGGIGSADLLLDYIVTSTDGQIDMIDQAYTGSAINGALAVDEIAATGAFGGTVVGSSHLQIGDFSDPPAETNDVLNIVPPETALYVTKDIAFAVTSEGGGFITISQVTQSFHQVPEPTAMLLGSLGGGLLLFLRLRRQARRD